MARPKTNFTRRELLVKYLELNGATQVPSTSSKYIKMQIKDSPIFYFVGKSGALRKGKNVVNSLSLTDYINWTRVRQTVLGN